MEQNTTPTTTTYTITITIVDDDVEEFGCTDTKELMNDLRSVLGDYNVTNITLVEV